MRNFFIFFSFSFAQKFFPKDELIQWYQDLQNENPNRVEIITNDFTGSDIFAVKIHSEGNNHVFYIDCGNYGSG
jgi:hypothetical protein